MDPDRRTGLRGEGALPAIHSVTSGSPIKLPVSKGMKTPAQNNSENCCGGGGGVHGGAGGGVGGRMNTETQIWGTILSYVYTVDVFEKHQVIHLEPSWDASEMRHKQTAPNR